VRIYGKKEEKAKIARARNGRKKGWIWNWTSNDPPIKNLWFLVGR